MLVAVRGECEKRGLQFHRSIAWVVCTVMRDGTAPQNVCFFRNNGYVANIPKMFDLGEHFHASRLRRPSCTRLGEAEILNEGGQTMIGFP